MKRFFVAVLWAVGAYIAVAFASYFLVLQFSPNAHDRSVEAAMTSVFFYGPVGALVGFVFGLVRGRRAATETSA
jgi:hypothetical protein